MIRRRVLPVALLSAISLASCAGRTAGPRVPGPGESAELSPGWSETGVASWYGEPFHGRTTASGEIYDMDRMTAAHRWLPFGSIVRVENRDNGRSTRVRINDRGPFVTGRIIDLSRAAARELGMVGSGTASVRIVVEEAASEPECLELQVGAFAEETNARAAHARIERAGYRAREVEGADGLRRVIAGPFADLASAESARRRLGGFLRACGGRAASRRNLGPTGGL